MSDRAAAIVAASLLEQRIDAALRAMFLDAQRPRSKGETVVSQAFRTSGPFGPFSTKIDMLLMLGMVSEQAHRDLFYIKEIRNSFAHKISSLSFEKAPIRDLTMELKLFEDHVGEAVKTEPGAYIPTKPMMYIKSRDEYLKKPRERYLICIALYSTILVTSPLKKQPLCRQLL